jgi:hypothetical protein
MERNMDMERLTHRGYRTSLMVALVLSGLVVTLVAVIGRGTLNLSGALLLAKPRDTTVIALVEPKLQEGVHISDIKFLRKEDAMDEEKPTYTYHVRTSDDSDYFTRLRFDTALSQWTLERFERLHGSEDALAP